MSSSSSLSSSGWIQTANQRLSFNQTATWAAYSSALAALTLNQMSDVAAKYQMGGLSPTPPTPPTPDSDAYSPSFSPDYAERKRFLKRSSSSDVIASSSSSSLCSNSAAKRSKSFTIDAILGLDGLAFAAVHHHQQHQQQQQQQQQQMNYNQSLFNQSSCFDFSQSGKSLWIFYVFQLRIFHSISLIFFFNFKIWLF